MNALIFGGNGALGKSLCNVFKTSWTVTSVDFQQNKNAQNNIQLQFNSKPLDQLKTIKQAIANKKFDCIICAAGGWVGGSIADDDFLQKYEDMHAKNVIPALISSSLTPNLADDGLLVLTGAHGVYKEPTPTMMAYALAKTTIHSLTLQMDMPNSSGIITILPEVIDTPGNRQAMPTADFSKWANTDQIAGLLKGWAEGLNRPATKSLIHLKVQNESVVPSFL